MKLHHERGGERAKSWGLACVVVRWLGLLNTSLDSRRWNCYDDIVFDDKRCMNCRINVNKK